ncbi:MAG: 2,3-diaminopropionate biosynthesis protein SbnB [Bryobacteraceae bacterium]|jgi:ornithine cyclodeaminase
MASDDLLLLRGQEIAALLIGRESEIVDAVDRAYAAHGRGNSALPNSTFLRFPDDARNRIIALPAYLGEDFATAGIKWISSFPGNHGLLIDRASAVIILNSITTGRPESILEGSVISAKRTAASAALAARVLGSGEQTAVGLIGCGLINYEIARFLLSTVPGITRFVVFDLKPEKAHCFCEKLGELSSGLAFAVAKSSTAVLEQTKLVSIATTAAVPHISDLSMCAEGTLILNVSLRDLSAETILRADNIVDDIDHVCRAQTSIHLAEQSAGHRRFVRGALFDVTSRRIAPRLPSPGVCVFSPFGLGVLDLAVSRLVCVLARASGTGMSIPGFFPESFMAARMDAVGSSR